MLTTSRSNLYIGGRSNLLAPRRRPFRGIFLVCQTDPDKLEIAHVSNEEIASMIGAKPNGKYVWRIGVEVVGDVHSKGPATNLVNSVTKRSLYEISKYHTCLRYAVFTLNRLIRRYVLDSNLAGQN